MAAEKDRGRFVWHDLMTADATSAIAFYGEIVGWGTSVWEGGDEPYTMWTSGDTPIGGIRDLAEQAKAAGASAHWLAYVACPEVEATVAQATELGAQVLISATEVPAVGCFAVLADPQGAVFAVFSAIDQAPGHDGPSQLGEFSWHELATTDQEAAFGFYSALFGWQDTESMDMGEMGVYRIYGRGGNVSWRYVQQALRDARATGLAKLCSSG